MSAEKKTRIEVQRILKKVLEDGLSALGHDGCAVMEFANASFQNADKVVLMNPIGTKRVGWQGKDYSPYNETLVMRESWIEEQRWQIHCVKKRITSSTDISPTAEDIADDLVTWFNGRGCEELRTYGMANLRIDSDAVIVYNDNSDLYQKRAVFTVKIRVPKELKSGKSYMDTLVPKIMPV
jgi:hypothetical protein